MEERRCAQQDQPRLSSEPEGEPLRMSRLLLSVLATLTGSLPACSGRSTLTSDDSAVELVDAGPLEGHPSCDRRSACGPWLVQCGGACIDPLTSLEHCGARGDCKGTSAGEKCATKTTCAAGACKELATSWGTATPIDNGAGDAHYPEIAMNASGDAVVVHYQWNDSAYDLYATRFSAKASSWGPATLIEQNSEDAMSPKVAIDASGNAIAVWNQAIGSSHSLHASRYSTSSGTWSKAVSINSAKEWSNPTIAMDAGGGAMAVWQQWSGSITHIYANRYDASIGYWGASIPIESNPKGADYPAIAMDSSGNAIVVYDHRRTTAVYDLYAIHYSAAVRSWGTPTLVGSSSGVATPPRIAMDASGNAFAVWQQGVNGSYDAWANRFGAADGTWGQGTLIASGCVLYSCVAADAIGDAIALHSQSYYCASSAQDVYARRYDAKIGAWGVAAPLESGADLAAGGSIAMDPSGNAIALWIQRPITALAYSLFASRGSVTSHAWGTPTLLYSLPGAENASVVMDASGNALVVWEQGGDTNNRIYAVRFQ
jgi:hypothetical protein